MTDHKSFFVLWSNAAVEAAGPNISALQAELIEEAAEIVSQARDWFCHPLRAYGEDACYTCTGHELEDRWEIYVQTAQYRDLEPLRGDHPDPKMRGKIIKFPEALKQADNEIFVPYEDIVAR